MKDIAAIVLAAGRSRRMGQFKPLLPFGDRRVVDHCLDSLRRGGVESIVVVVGHRAADLQNHLQTANVVFALNPDPDSAMSDSIACGVKLVPPSAKAILITPVDHAAVPPPVVSNIIGAWQEGARLVVPTWEGRGGHPVLLNANFREELLRLDQERGLRGLFEAYSEQVKRLKVESSYIARDMDTWDDYISLHKDVFGVPPRQPLDHLEPEQPQGQETN
ncbi:MAG TPA: nucleotidyltransferase family protein [Pyrinomonadaceae bacterium]